MSVSARDRGYWKGIQMKKGLIGAAVFAALVVGVGTPALAGGPPDEVFYGNDDVWACNEGVPQEPMPPVPPFHCLQVKSQGNVGLIIVLEPDPRGPAEGVTTDAAFDARPCPHDDPPGTDQDDGTWWSPAEGLYVCHHKPVSPPKGSWRD
jgi:hypothetical protein